MSSIALRIQNISKKYRIGAVRHDTLRDQIAHIASSSFQRTKNNKVPNSEIWALKDVSFDVHHGEIVGIIGRNGAGKSTLLKILSRITVPTSGRVEIFGKVGSLLEVGTGFHPELTGRENIYLNGAILGMHRAEIERKFDEIVAFSEIEKFLDTPVKRYSSGMYVRLAFAVAAHLDTEILLVDEVLAVGDTAFQRKCLGKMGEVANQGRTVLFVSHNMAAIQTLCNRGIFLSNGLLTTEGPISNVIEYYLNTLEKWASHNLVERKERYGKGRVKFIKVKTTAGIDSKSGILITGQSACFIFFTNCYKSGLTCQFTIYSHLGQAIVNFNSGIQSSEDTIDKDINNKFVCEIDELNLLPGRYRINVALILNGEYEDHIEAAAYFDVEASQIQSRPVAHDHRSGNIYIPHRWSIPNK